MVLKASRTAYVRSATFSGFWQAGGERETGTRVAVLLIDNRTASRTYNDRYGTKPLLADECLRARRSFLETTFALGGLWTSRPLWREEFAVLLYRGQPRVPWPRWVDANS